MLHNLLHHLYIQSIYFPTILNFMKILKPENLKIIKFEDLLSIKTEKEIMNNFENKNIEVYNKSEISDNFKQKNNLFENNEEYLIEKTNIFHFQNYRNGDRKIEKKESYEIPPFKYFDEENFSFKKDEKIKSIVIPEILNFLNLCPFDFIFSSSLNVKFSSSKYLKGGISYDSFFSIFRSPFL